MQTNKQKLAATKKQNKKAIQKSIFLKEKKLKNFLETSQENAPLGKKKKKTRQKKSNRIR